MVAEPFVFLSVDRQVEVRCCLTRGTPLFCVVDFIRRTANRRMGPLDALQVWMHTSLMLQNKEHDIANAYVYKFPGPYERPNICVSANGLLVLYHHMDSAHGLVNKQYRMEVQERLMLLTTGKGVHFIEEYDDGEIEEQLKEEDGRGFTEPPANSKFWYVPTATVGTGEDVKDMVPLEAALERRCAENEELESRLRLSEEELARERNRAQNTETLLKKRVQQLEEALPRKGGRDGGFTLNTLAKSLNLELEDQRFTSRLFKRVVAKFKREHPAVGLGRRQHVVHFPGECKDRVAGILEAECVRMKLEIAGNEHWVNAEGSEDAKK